MSVRDSLRRALRERRVAANRGDQDSLRALDAVIDTLVAQLEETETRDDCHVDRRNGHGHRDTV